MPVIFMERSLLDSLTEADIKEIIDENEGHTKYARLEGYYEGDHIGEVARLFQLTAYFNRLSLRHFVRHRHSFHRERIGLLDVHIVVARYECE